MSKLLAPHLLYTGRNAAGNRLVGAAHFQSQVPFSVNQVGTGTLAQVGVPYFSHFRRRFELLSHFSA